MNHRRCSLLELDCAHSKCARTGQPKAASLFQRQRPASPRPGRSVTVEARSYDTGSPIRVQKPTPRRPIGLPPRSSAWSANAVLSGYPGDGVSPYRVERFDGSSPGEAASSQGLLAAAQSWTGRTLRARPVEPYVSSAQAFADSLSVDDTAVDDDLQLIAARAGQPVPAPQPAQQFGAPSPSATPAPQPMVDPYSIFDQMGRSMQYANTFNLGSIELERRFNAFEHELDRDEAKEAAAQAVALSHPPDLDEIDLVSELALISEVAPAARQPRESEQTDGPREVTQAEQSVPDRNMLQPSSGSDN